VETKMSEGLQWKFETVLGLKSNFSYLIINNVKYLLLNIIYYFIQMILFTQNGIHVIFIISLSCFFLFLRAMLYQPNSSPEFLSRMTWRSTCHPLLSY